MPSPPGRSACAGSPTSSAARRPARSARPASSSRTPAARAWHDLLRRLPLARRARQRDRLGRAPHTAPARSRRASARAARARVRGTDPARPLPARVRPRARGPLLALRDRQRAARGRRRGRARATRAARVAHLPPEVEPAAGLARARPRRARGGLRRRRRLARRRPPTASSRAYRPGGGRNPAFAEPLVCPSLLPPLAPNCDGRGPAGLAAGGAGSRGSTTGGSQLDCDPVVDPAEDPRAERRARRPPPRTR